MGTKSPKISVIIPTYNGERYIDRNLQSLKNQSISNELEIIILDNNSKDRTVSKAKSFNSLDIKIIENNQNLGYAKACNLGAQAASGGFLFFTNQDVIFPPKFFAKCLDIYKKLNKNIDPILSPAVVFPDKSIHYYGGIIHYSGISYCPKMYDKLPEKKETFRTSKASGCSMFLRKETFLNLDGYDSFFFMYKEDVDFSMKALRKGIPIYSTNEPFLYHLRKHDYINNFVYYFMERNRFLIIFKHISNLKKIIPYLLMIEIVLFFHSILENKLLHKLKTYFFVLKNLKKLIHLRNDPINNRAPKFKKNQLSNPLSPILLGNLKKNQYFLNLLKFFNIILEKL